jgi:hypothetical protein
MARFNIDGLIQATIDAQNPEHRESRQYARSLLAAPLADRQERITETLVNLETKLKPKVDQGLISQETYDLIVAANKDVLRATTKNYVDMVTQI